LNHEEYLKHIKKHLDISRKDNEFLKNVKLDEEIFTIMVNLNLDTARDILKPIPVNEICLNYKVNSMNLHS
jgi:hypothetical protein